MTNANLLRPRVAVAFYGRFPRLRDLQEQSIPPLLAGRNLILCAGTGSGKTEAVLAPLVSRWWSGFHETDTTTILYVVPTRALVNDLEERLHLPISGLGLRLGIRHSDRDDTRTKRKPHILLTTPESLDVMICRNDGSLESVRALIADEVHLFYNTQRGLYLAILLQRLGKLISEDNLQIAALSATIGDLQDIAQFFLLSTDTTEMLEFPTFRSIHAQVRGGDMPDVVSRLRSDHGLKLLAFVNKRGDCDEIASSVTETGSFPGPVLVHYSSLSRENRVRVERQFAAARNALCVSTSTLELGIDIGDIDAVLLCSVPFSVESFLQRIGRGNRRTNATNAVCFVGMCEDQEDGDEEYQQEPLLLQCLRFLTLIDAATKGEMPRHVPRVLFGAVVQQCLSVLYRRGGRYTRVSEILDVFAGFRNITGEIFRNILEELERTGYLRLHPYRNQYCAGEALHELADRHLILGNFPASAKEKDVRHGSLVIGTVPGFNVDLFGQGDVISFGGRRWIVSAISRDFLKVEATPQGHPKRLTYAGASEEYDAYFTDRVWRMIHADDFQDNSIAGTLRKEVVDSIARVRSACTEDQLPWCRFGDRICYYTFAGALVNRAIALFSRQQDYDVGSHRLIVSAPIDWQSLPDDPHQYVQVLDERFRRSGEQSIFQKMLPEELQTAESLEMWLKDVAVSRVLSRLVRSQPIQVSGFDWPFP